MQNPPPDQSKSSTGLDENIAALLSYVLTWLTGLIFYLVEKENRFVRFHAMQAILFGVVITVVSIVLNVILGIFSYISWILGTLVGLVFALVTLVFVVAWIICMVKAYQRQIFKLPVIGNIAEGIVNK